MGLPCFRGNFIDYESPEPHNLAVILPKILQFVLVT